jgi:hypothetical protein
MARSRSSALHRRATLVAAYATPEAGRIACSAIRERQLAAASLIWLIGGVCRELDEAPAVASKLAVEGPLLTPLRARSTARHPLLGVVADDLRRLGILESSLDHYALHLEWGHAVLVAHGLESEIESAFRILERASLAIHHVALN